jgi:hypothetical protein
LVKRLVGTKAETLKLGLDLHARDVVVCVQVDGARPQRPQRMTTVELLQVVGGLVAAGRKVYSCYEAGPCGYGLHRELLVAGATNYVVAPAKLGDGRQQKTDNLDATALTDQLDRYVRGHTKAFTVVRVPTPAEEQARVAGRLREQLKHTRHEWEARGRSLLLCHGHHVRGVWWSARRWTELKGTLPDWLGAELEVMRTVLLTVDAQERARRKALERRRRQRCRKRSGPSPGSRSAWRSATGIASRTADRSRATPACVPGCGKAAAADGTGPSTGTATRACVRCSLNWSGAWRAGSRTTRRSGRWSPGSPAERSGANWRWPPRGDSRSICGGWRPGGPRRRNSISSFPWR